MNKLDIRVVTLSHRRADRIRGWTLKLFPDALVCIDENELEDYLPYVPKEQLLLHPTFRASAEIRNFIRDKVDAEIVVVPDDDCIHFVSFTGGSIVNYANPVDVMAIVENTAVISKQIGAYHFGWNKIASPFGMFAPNPFQFDNWTGGIVGIIGNQPKVRYDDDMLLRADIDYCLKHLLHNRIVFRDDRFYMTTAPMYREPGGNNIYRTETQIKGETELMKKRWGKWIQFKEKQKSESTMIATVLVKRQQK